MLAKHHKDIANMLNGRGVQPGADFSEQCVASFVLNVVYTHFDQFVCFQAAVNFGEDSFAEALLTDADDRMEVMGAGAQGAAQG